MEFTDSVRSFHVPDTPSTSAWPPRRPSVPTSRATRVTSEAKDESWSTIVLMVALSSRISPFTSTVIFLERSPAATALVTSAMLRTCEVRLPAIEFTESVRSRQVPATPCTSAWPPSFPSVPTSLRDSGDFRRKRAQLVHHRVDGVLEFQNFALHVHRDLLGEVARRHRLRHVGDVPHLRGQVAGHGVHRLREVAPGARHALHVGLAAELAFGSHFPRDARHLGGERTQLVHHRVDGVLELENLALHVHRDLLGEVARRHRLRHVGDVAHLRGEVAGHRVHRLGQVLPRAGHALHVGLAAELAFRAHLARHPRHLGGERAQLVHHRVDGVLQLERSRPSRPP